MYDELVKRLRSVKDSWQTEEESWMLQAADAIEDLEFACDHYEKDYKALCDYLPKWIPVTERLPEEGQVVCVSDGKNTWDYGTFRGVFKVNGEWYWKKRTMKTVKWWMPKSDALPEPPEEET